MRLLISSIDNANTGTRGNCVYLPMISNSTDKTQYKESSLNFEYTTDRCFPSNLARDE